MTPPEGGVTLSAMPCQTLAALQSPGQLAHTIRTVRRPQRAPLAFAFQHHNERVRYAAAPHATAPPVLLLSPHRPLLRALRVDPDPDPDTPEPRTGRVIEGVLLWLGRKPLLATAARVRPRLLSQGIGRLADLAGLPRPRLEVLTGKDGHGVLQTLRAARAVGRLRDGVHCWVQAGPVPGLRLKPYAPAPAPVGWISGSLSRVGGTIWFDTPAGIERAGRARAALVALAALCGVARLRKVVVRYGMGPAGAHRHALPAPGAAAQLAHAFQGIEKGYRLDDGESNTIASHGASPTYGELTPVGIDRIFSLRDPRGRSFLDMGSGMGRAVLAAGLGYPLACAHGVELSATRSASGRSALRSLRAHTGRRWPQIRLFEGDMLRFNVRRYDTIFISNLCFDTAFNQKLAARFDQELRPGTHVFSSKRIDGARNVSQRKVEGVTMSWNPRSSVYHSIWC